MRKASGGAAHRRPARRSRQTPAGDAVMAGPLRWSSARRARAPQVSAPSRAACGAPSDPDVCRRGGCLTLVLFLSGPEEETSGPILAESTRTRFGPLFCRAQAAQLRFVMFDDREAFHSRVPGLRTRARWKGGGAVI